MNIKSILIIAYTGLNTANLINAFPHTVILKNKTKVTQIASITSSFKINNIPVEKNDAIETRIAPGSSFSYGSQNHTFITLIIKVRSSRVQNSLVTGLGELGQVAIIELLDNGNFKTYSAGYFEQAQLRAMAAKRAAAERWVQTKAWFSSLWSSIKIKFFNFFSLPAPQPNTTAPNNHNQVALEPMITILNHTEHTIYLGGAFITKSGELATSMQLTSETFIRRPFSAFSGNTLLFDTSQYLTKPGIINLERYRDEASQHSAHEELYIEIKQDEHGDIAVIQPVWLKIAKFQT